MKESPTSALPVREVCAVSVLSSTVAVATANSIIAADAAKFIKIYKILINASEDITGEIYATLGSTKIGSIQTAKAGAQYILANPSPGYIESATGDALTITLPEAKSISYIVYYQQLVG